MKALVTGANGFTGSYLTKHLIEKGYDVTALVRKNSDLKLLEGIRVKFFYADLATHPSFDGRLNEFDVIFHVAAAYRTEHASQDHFWKVNVEGTQKLLEAATKANLKRFVHCSTVGVQGEIADPPATEEAPYNHGDHYQQSKMEGEKLALRFHKEHGLPVTVIRPVGIYGPGDFRFYKLFKFINNGTFRMIGSGKVLYHLTYVEDLVRGIVLAAENPDAVGEIFTIGGNEYLPLKELVAKIAEVLNKPVPTKHLPLAPVYAAALLCEAICKPLGIAPPLYRRRLDFFTKDRAFDISKARKVLQYEPTIDLRTGLERTARWYKKEGFLD